MIERHAACKISGPKILNSKCSRAEMHPCEFFVGVVVVGVVVVVVGGGQVAPRPTWFRPTSLPSCHICLGLVDVCLVAVRAWQPSTGDGVYNE